jgi:hypothetical protein
MRAIIEERGNDFPSVGNYVPGSDGNLYLVTYVSGHIMTQQYKSNTMHCEVVQASWDDCTEDDEFSAMIRFEDELGADND